jgi:hypothetical protein
MVDIILHPIAPTVNLQRSPLGNDGPDSWIRELGAPLIPQMSVGTGRMQRVSDRRRDLERPRRRLGHEFVLVVVMGATLHSSPSASVVE